MDPDATLRMIAESEDSNELYEACSNLQEWLEKGGCHPCWDDQPHATAVYGLWCSC